MWVLVCSVSLNDGDLHSHALCFFIWCLQEGSLFFFLLAVSVSIARTSKFSHLLRLADNFWWWVTIRAKRLYLGLVSASVSMWLLSPLLSSCLISFCCLYLRLSISSSLAEPLPLTWWETSAECEVGFIPRCQRALVWSMMRLRQLQHCVIERFTLSQSMRNI